MQKTGSLGATGRPNILVIVAGQIAGADFPDGPAQHLHMPHLRQFARGAMCFRQAMAPSPDDAPASAAILTGRMPLRTGLCTAFDGWLGAGQPTLGHVLRRAGYLTAVAGDAAPLSAGGDYGFDLRLRIDPMADGFTHDDHATDLACRFLAERGDAAQPWCLTVNLRQPQKPFAARRRDRLLYNASPALPDDLSARAMLQGYFAALSGFDDRVGLLLRALGSRLARTVVAVVGCRGAAHDESADPLADTRLHVPLMISHPSIPAAQVDAAVSTIDLLPTLARIAGLDDCIDTICDGVDLIRTATDGLRPMIAAESLAGDRFDTRLISGVWSAFRSFQGGSWGDLRLTENGRAFVPHGAEAAQIADYFTRSASFLWPDDVMQDLLAERIAVGPWVQPRHAAGARDLCAPDHAGQSGFAAGAMRQLG